MSFFSDNLKQLRIKSGKSRKELADFIEVSVSAYTNYENGLREPKLDTLVLIAICLSVSVDELLGIDTEDIEFPEETQKKEILSYFKKAGFTFIREDEEIMSFKYGDNQNFNLPKDIVIILTSEFINEGHELGEKYIVDKIKMFFSSGKQLTNWISDNKE